MMRKILVLALLACTGCFQTSSDDDDLRIVPVTNNPYVIPNNGGGIPGMPSGSGGPQ